MLTAETELGDISYNENYERGPRSVFTSLIASGDTVADVGASTGLYTLPAASAAGPEGEVVAFEPSDRVETLARNLEVNGYEDVRIENCAVSDSAGETEFIERKEPRQRSRSVSLDEYFERPPDVVKIDVEGHEVSILHGMRETLAQRITDVLCETHPEKCAVFGDDLTDIDDILSEFGYEVYAVSDDGELTPTTASGDKQRCLFTPASDTGPPE
ncbi:FkbM family methyltransferase [Halosimplex salinum]|uniref:FkbM family methyltransferase n=1 Tax=Halosimplex salinum TaxID=1710538 RepID=UPI0013DE370C|nr:FkbM family methyltransferase [Halosimplex salinum]